MVVWSPFRFNEAADIDDAALDLDRLQTALSRRSRRAFIPNRRGLAAPA
jgi:hypothetical protein